MVTRARAEPTRSLATLLRRILRDTLRSAVARVRDLTRDAVARRAREGEAWRVIAIGKAALTMFEGASAGLAQAGALVRESLVVSPAGTALPRSDKYACYMHAAHPLPDARSVRAAKRALAVAGRAGAASGALARGNLLVLVSGGASSLVSLPAGISLAKKREVSDALLRAGATIEEVNLVRRHLSAIKGGALLRAAGRARVVTLMVSDVLADAPWDIGSGPTAPDPTTRAEAAAVLRRRVPGLSALPLVETLKPPSSSTAAATGDVELIASPRWFARELAAALATRGFTPRVIRPSSADVTALATNYARAAKRLAPGTAIIRAAEPSLRVPHLHGRGGRCTQLCALVAARLPPGVVFLAGATDGADGSSRTSGAAVFASSFEKLRAASSAAVRDFDAGPLHVRAGTALPAKPSGVNFADVHVLAAAAVSVAARKARARVTSS